MNKLLHKLQNNIHDHLFVNNVLQSCRKLVRIIFLWITCYTHYMTVSVIVCLWMALLHTLQENGRGYECFSSCGQLFFSVNSLFHALQESSCDHLIVTNVLHTLYVWHLLHLLYDRSRGHLYVIVGGYLFDYFCLRNLLFSLGLNLETNCAVC